MKDYLNVNNKFEYKVLFYIFLFSITYSLSFYGWNEATEWSYIYSDRFEVSEYNNHYVKGINVYSLLYMLPSYLFDLGINKHLVNYFILVTVNSVAFYGIFLLGRLTFSNFNIAIYILITFLFISFIDKHGYKLVYPNNYWVFGQFGCYLSILTLSAFFLNHKRVSTILLVLLLSTHFVWFVWTIFF